MNKVLFKVETKEQRKFLFYININLKWFLTFNIILLISVALHTYFPNIIYTVSVTFTI